MAKSITLNDEVIAELGWVLADTILATSVNRRAWACEQVQEAIAAARHLPDRNVKLMNLYDDEIAMEEGWLLVVQCNGVQTVQKFDDDPNETFPTDEEAVKFVQSQADAGSEMHQSVLAIHNTALADTV